MALRYYTPKGLQKRKRNRKRIMFKQSFHANKVSENTTTSSKSMYKEIANFRYRKYDISFISLILWPAKKLAKNK
jgi:hypothetical protein